MSEKTPQRAIFFGVFVACLGIFYSFGYRMGLVKTEPKCLAACQSYATGLLIENDQNWEKWLKQKGCLVERHPDQMNLPMAPAKPSGKL
jgi:hypothetical protein